MPVRSRLAIWCLALLLSIMLYVKGRVPAEKGGDAAFPRLEKGKVTVRLAGEFPRPGVYLFPEGASALTAIKMTLPGKSAIMPASASVSAALQSGDVVTLSRSGSKNPVISITKMVTREKMLLGIPLHPDRMTEEDWTRLPGIGPVLARRIVDDRQKYGAFGSVEGVLRVPGIGPARLAAIRRYF